jgi:fructokinase
VEEMTKFKVAGLGEVLWDIYDDQKFVGGSPANFAVHAALYGCESYLLSRVGDDEAGRQLVAELKRFSVNISCLQSDIFKATGKVRIRLDERGKPNYSCSESVAFDDMRLDSAWEELAPQLDAVFWGMLAQRSESSRLAVQGFLRLATKAVKLFDVNLNVWDQKKEPILLDSLQQADIIKLNRQECAVLKQGFKSSEQDLVFLRRILDQFKLKMAALTLGEHGCYLITADAQEFDPGYFITQVDASGAGDAFAAGLMIKYLEGASLPETADFANQLAAFVVQHYGAVPVWSMADLETLAVTNL